MICKIVELLLQKWRKKFAFLSTFVRRPEKASIDRYLKPISLAKDLHQVLKLKKNWHLAGHIYRYTPHKTSPISATADQYSIRLATIFNAHCTVHCTMEDVIKHVANHNAKPV